MAILYLSPLSSISITPPIHKWVPLIRHLVEFPPTIFLVKFSFSRKKHQKCDTEIDLNLLPFSDFWSAEYKNVKSLNFRATLLVYVGNFSSGDRLLSFGVKIQIFHFTIHSARENWFVLCG